MNQTTNPTETTTYCTGSTTPPKSRTGLITVLLIMVIVLSTIVTVLSMMNIHLFRLLEKEEDTPIQFSRTQEGNCVAALTADAEDIIISPLGLTGREIPAYYRSYNNLPVGIYVTNVEENSPAANANIRNGDIIVNINGTPITCRECLQNVFPASRSLTDMDVTIYRDEEEITHRITP